MISPVEWKQGKIRLIDQTRLPQRLVYCSCNSAADVAKAIREMKVRGAPAIGVAAAFGVAREMMNSRARDYRRFRLEMDRAIRVLAASRPTAINLFWALARMRKTAEKNQGLPPERLKQVLLAEARSILEEDRSACRRMAISGAKLIKDGDAVLTHCNAGGLATTGIGTALGAIVRAREEGKRIAVFAGETRPLLQGARLTTWELRRQGIDVILICDNMAAALMRAGKISRVMTGADRIAANGDAANKIGTYGLAVLARAHRIPFHVLAPLSSFDFHLRSGEKIPIEERDGDEVRCFQGKWIAPRRVRVYNPAFDITPHRLISAIVTEYGIFRPPYSRSLARLKRAAEKGIRNR